jgi:hypothetical protein
MKGPSKDARLRDTRSSFAKATADKRKTRNSDSINDQSPAWKPEEISLHDGRVQVLEID